MTRNYHNSDAPIDYVAVGGRTMRTLLGSFSTREKADIWVASANEWYGQLHPLTPVRVEEVRRDTRPFPTEALRQMREAPSREEEDAAIVSLFNTLVDEPTDFPVPPAVEPQRPKIGGRKK